MVEHGGGCVINRLSVAALIPRIAETDEILNPVFYLASEGYTTDITLVADGGLMAKRWTPRNLQASNRAGR